MRLACTFVPECWRGRWRGLLVTFAELEDVVKFWGAGVDPAGFMEVLQVVKEVFVVIEGHELVVEEGHFLQQCDEVLEVAVWSQF